MAHKFVAAAILLALTLSGVAAAQNTSGTASTDARMGTERQINMRHRMVLPPGDGTTLTYHRVCGWRSDGGAVTGAWMRLPLGVTISTCQVNQSRPLGASCHCNNHDGNVIEVPT